MSTDTYREIFTNYLLGEKETWDDVIGGAAACMDFEDAMNVDMDDEWDKAYPDVMIWTKKNIYITYIDPSLMHHNIVVVPNVSMLETLDFWWHMMPTKEAK